MPENDFGILFVHGIGQQKSGETLHATAGPLLAWLARNHVKFESVKTVLKPGAGEMAITELTWTPLGSPPVKVLLAESCWAEVFESPSAFQFAKWLYGPGSTVLVSQMAEWCLDVAYRFVDAVNWPLKLLGTAWNPPMRADGLQVSLGCLVAVGTLLLIPPFQILILILAVLAAVPFLQIGTLAGTVLRNISSILGDAYVFSEGFLDREAIRSKIQEDLRWLNERCRQTALVAHSQGAAAAVEAVRQGDPRPGLLVTYGSGWRKLRQLRSRELNVTVVCEFVLPAISVAGFWIFTSDAPGAAAVGVILILSLVWAGSTAVAEVAQAESDLVNETSAILATGLRWVDMIAAMDPVPGGMLFRWQQRAGRQREGRRITWNGFAGSTGSFQTVLVVNQDNPLSDHTAYWRSTDFIRNLAVALQAFSKKPLFPAPALEESRWSYAYQHLRCMVRNVSHGATYALAAVLYWRADEEVRRAMTLAIPWVSHALKGMLDGAESQAPAVAWLLGALVIVGVTVAWTQLVSGRVWEIWDRHRVTAGWLSRTVERVLGLLYLASAGLPIYFLLAGLETGKIATAASVAAASARWAALHSIDFLMIAPLAALAIMLLAAVVLKLWELARRWRAG